jgi:hypothetical protein
VPTDNHNPDRRFVRGGLVAVAALLIGGVFSLIKLVPPTPDSLYPKCISYQFTSIHCPGCGMARATHSFLNGRIEQAFAYNFLGMALLPLGVFILLRWVYHFVRGTPPKPLPGRIRMPQVLMVAFVLFWILRNIPAYPFTLLAPHELK